MKRISLFLLLFTKASIAQDTVLDLTNLHSYANQTVPAYIAPDNTPANNQITDIGATLGRVLFYDKRLSSDATVSCASCHQQERAFSDTAIASTGVAGTTGRHSMRLINARFSREAKFFWDERADTLEAQTTQPIQDHIEMGFSGADGDPDLSVLLARIADIELYQVLFTAVYGSPAITESRMQKALAQFVRSIQSFDSKFDQGFAATPNPNPNTQFANFTAQENLGKQLFSTPPNQGGAGCATCHVPPTFDIDPNSGHNGVTGAIGGGQDLTNTRSPSLRDLVDGAGNPNGPFMHDGSKATLLDVVNHYNAIPAVTPGLDPRLGGGPPVPGGPPQAQNLNLTQTEKDALVSFLETLTGSSVYTDEKWSSPFNAANELSFVVLPTQVTFGIESSGGSEDVTVSAKGVPNVTYLLKKSTDLENWDEGVQVVASASGELEYVTTAAPAKQFFIFGYGVD